MVSYHRERELDDGGQYRPPRLSSPRTDESRENETLVVPSSRISVSAVDIVVTRSVLTYPHDRGAIGDICLHYVRSRLVEELDQIILRHASRPEGLLSISASAGLAPTSIAPAMYTACLPPCYHCPPGDGNPKLPGTSRLLRVIVCLVMPAIPRDICSP